jgi:hypothetical protein
MNPILAYFKEFILRLQATSPKFFQVLKVISVILIALCTGLLQTLPAETLSTIVIAWLGWTWSTILNGAIVWLTAVFVTATTTAKNVERDVTNKL